MRDKPLLLAWKGMNFFQVGAGFKPNLGKGLWYPKLFSTPLLFELFEYMKHRKFLRCFWS
jgi:hypothetical protein